jgi:hypothetical protein
MQLTPSWRRTCSRYRDRSSCFNMSMRSARLSSLIKRNSQRSQIGRRRQCSCANKHRRRHARVALKLMHLLRLLRVDSRRRAAVESTPLRLYLLHQSLLHPPQRQLHQSLQTMVQKPLPLAPPDPPARVPTL